MDEGGGQGRGRAAGRGGSGLPACPSRGEPADPRLADRCGTCNRALLPLSLRAQVEGTLRAGQTVSIRLRVVAGARALEQLVACVGAEQRFLDPESDLNAELATGTLLCTPSNGSNVL